MCVADRCVLKAAGIPGANPMAFNNIVVPEEEMISDIFHILLRLMDLPVLK